MSELPDLKNSIFLFISSSYTKEKYLRGEKERQIIKDTLERSSSKKTISFQDIVIENRADLFQKLSSYKPLILHFSTHGTTEDGPLFEEDEKEGSFSPIKEKKEDLLNILKKYKDNIRLIIFNCCYCSDVAAKASKFISCTIGPVISVYDDHAIAFSQGFYEVLFENDPIETAFESGLRRYKIAAMNDRANDYEIKGLSNLRISSIVEKASSQYLDFLKKKVKESIDSLKEKFIPDIHKTSYLEKFLEERLKPKAYFAEKLEELCKNMGEYELRLKGYQIPHNQEKKNDSQNIEEIIIITKQIIEKTSNIIQNIFKFSKQLLVENVYFNEANTFFEREGIELIEIYNNKSLDNNIPAMAHLEQLINEFSYYFYSFVHLAEEITSKTIGIFGEAGVGKTELCCNIASNRINNNLPTVFLLGFKFRTDDNLKTQILRILGYPENDWDNFLSSMDEAGKKTNSKSLLIIDAINESITSNGRLSRIWNDDLPELIKEIERYQNLFLLITYRNGYESLLNVNLIFNSTLVLKWLDFDITDMIEKYLNYFKIRAKISQNIKVLFKKPLFLKLFCEINKNRALDAVNELDISDLFETYLNLLNKKLAIKHGYDEKSRIFFNKLNKICDYIWEKNENSLNIDNYILLTKDDIPWDQSIGKSISEEILLFNRDFIQSKRDDRLVFCFNMVGGYLVARFLVDTKKINRNTIKRLTPKTKRSHPLLDDILFSLVQIFAKKKHQIRNIFRFPYLPIPAFFYLPLDILNTKFLMKIQSFFKSVKEFHQFSQISDYFLVNSENINHPLNGDILFDILEKKPMNERDILWTESIRKNIQEFSKFNSEFRITLAKKDNGINRDLVDIKIQMVVWMLTSININFRNAVSESIYEYGKKRPEKLIELVQKCVNINDQYVLERLIAICYGILMFFHNNVHRSNYNKIFYDWKNIFQKILLQINRNKICLNILILDHIDLILKTCNMNIPDSLSKKENDNLKNNRKVKKNWKRIEKQELGYFRISHLTPFKYSFEKMISYSILDKSLDEIDEKAYELFKEYKENIFWYMKKIGYNAQFFEKYEKEIDNSIELNDNKEFTEFYSQKYAWISYFNLYGYLTRLRILNKEKRIKNYLFDPSFPKEPRNIESSINLIQDPDSKWISNVNIEELEPLLIKDELSGITGPWVLLNARYSQKNDKEEYSSYGYIEGFGYLNENKIFDMNGFKTLMISKKDAIGRIYSSLSDLSRIYAGEYPWSDFISRYPRSYLDEFEDVQELTICLNFRDITNIKIDNYYVPSKDICVSLDLLKNDENVELIDKAGNICSMTIQLKNIQGNFCYIKQDILEKYLKQKSAIFFYVFNPERSEKIQESDLGISHNYCYIYAVRVFWNGSAETFCLKKKKSSDD